MMAEMNRIKRNVQKMVNMGASEQEIDQYIEEEGVSIERVRNHKITTGLRDQPTLEGVPVPMTQSDTGKPAVDYEAFFNAPEQAQDMARKIGPILAFGQGSSLGLQDEIIGLGGDRAKFMTRLAQNEYAQENPLGSLALNVAGGIATGIPTGNMALGTQLGQRSPLLATSILGATEGGIAGAGFSDEQNIPQNMLTGAATGAAMPFALKGAMSGARHGVTAGRKLMGLPTRLAQGPEKAAVNQVAKAFKRDKIPLQQAMQELQDRGDDAVLADVGGQNVLDLGQNMFAKPGAAAQTARESLEGRVGKMVPRLLKSVRDLTGANKSVFQARKASVARSIEEASPLYQQLHPQPVSITDDLDDLFQTPFMKTAYKKALQLARNDPEFPKNISLPSSKEIQSGDTVPLAALDWTKRSLDGMIESAKRGANPDKNKVRILTQLKRQLTGSLDERFPEYKQARSIWAGEAAAQDALERGKRVLLDDAEEVWEEVSNMSQSEKQHFMYGAVESIANKIKGAKQGQDAARRISSYLVKERMRNAFPDEDSYRAFVNQLDNESLFAQTRNEILKGSPTAKRLAVDLDTGIDAGVEAAQGRILNSALSVIRKWSQGIDKIPENTRSKIADLLFTDIAKQGKVTTKTLNALKRQQIRDEQIKQLINRINAVATLPATEAAITSE